MRLPTPKGKNPWPSFSIPMEGVHMSLVEHVGCRVGSCESCKLGPGCGTFPPTNMELHRQPAVGVRVYVWKMVL